MKKKRRLLFLLAIFSMAIVNQCFAQTHETISLEVTPIQTLPAWYLQAREKVTADWEKLYHRYEADQAKYLKVDSHHHNQFLLVEITKESLKLFFRRTQGKKSM